jgi:hypothetical protein
LYYCFYHSWIYILLASFYYHTVRNVRRGPSCTWSCGSWIYNYLCNQSLSPLMLWVRIQHSTVYNIMR